MVSFAPSDGVLNAVCILERGIAFAPQLRALGAKLGAAVEAGEVVRFKVAGLVGAGARGIEGFLVDGCLDGARELRVPVDLDRDAPASSTKGSTKGPAASTVDVMDHAADASRLGDPGDWAPDADAPTLRVFVLGKRLNAAALRACVRSCVVPNGFVYAADEELDFGLFANGDDGDDDPLSRIIAGAPPEARASVDVDVGGAPLTITRAPDGAYAARRPGSDAVLEVIRMFNSALYVALPSTEALPAPPPLPTKM